MVGGNNLTDVESLPDEVLFEVLVRIPAQDIHDSVRLVCSKWYHMTHTHTIIIKIDSLWLWEKVVESRYITTTGTAKSDTLPVRSSCNGLVLESEEETETVENVHVSNPATMQIFTLRPLVGYRLALPLFAIGYAASSMKYKAVILSMPGKDMEDKCFILTIGVDNSWRTTIETSGPTPEGYRRNTYLSTGRYVSLLRPCGEMFWQVWEMKPEIDYQWRKVWDINLEDYKCTTFQLLDSRAVDFVQPIGWLKYLEILVFRKLSYTPQSRIFVYYLLTHEIVTIELPAQHSIYDRVVHKDSLVSLGGC
ncbi:hypothetical protein CASFOL_030999 [Castilleja foliolosa]|uniref:F-box domain-containing protein n=1 Tax=Castilleja foliolosa TaxID=1961234 RepID=A0ABD3C6W0_9LAMI